MQSAEHVDIADFGAEWLGEFGSAVGLKPSTTRIWTSGTAVSSRVRTSRMFSTSWYVAIMTRVSTPRAAASTLCGQSRERATMSCAIRSSALISRGVIAAPPAGIHESVKPNFLFASTVTAPVVRLE